MKAVRKISFFDCFQTLTHLEFHFFDFDIQLLAGLLYQNL